MAKLLYGSALRLMECVRLRIKACPEYVEGVHRLRQPADPGAGWQRRRVGDEGRSPHCRRPTVGGRQTGTSVPASLADGDVCPPESCRSGLGEGWRPTRPASAPVSALAAVFFGDEDHARRVVSQRLFLEVAVSGAQGKATHFDFAQE